MDFFFFLSWKHDFPNDTFGTQKTPANMLLSSLGNSRAG